MENDRERINVRKLDCCSARDHNADECCHFRGSGFDLGKCAQRGRQLEANSIARRIRQLLDDGVPRIVDAADKTGSTLRAAMPGDIAILFRALSDVVAKTLPYDSLAALRQALFKAVPHLMRIDQVEAGNADAIKTLAGQGGNVEKAPFKTPVEDFYLTNPISRASAVMAECSRLASGHMLTAAE